MNEWLNATVKVAEQCELAAETSANITLPPNQSQHTGLNAAARFDLCWTDAELFVVESM